MAVHCSEILNSADAIKNPWQLYHALIAFVTNKGQHEHQFTLSHSYSVLPYKNIAFQKKKPTSSYGRRKYNAHIPKESQCVKRAINKTTLRMHHNKETTVILKLRLVWTVETDE